MMNRRKIVTGVMAGCLFLSALLTPRFVSDVYAGQNTWEVGDDVKAVLSENGTLTLSGQGETYDYSTSDDGRTPFYGERARITSVVILDGVTSIGACLFYDCGSLSGELVIPGSVERIGNMAFSGEDEEHSPKFSVVESRYDRSRSDFQSDISVFSSETESAVEETETEGLEAKPVGEEAEPASEEAEPAGEEAEPASEEAEPASEEAEPAGEEAEPAGEEAEPAGEEAEPAGEEAEPAGEEAEPAGEEAEPAGEEAEPVGVEAEPVGVEAELSRSRESGNGEQLIGEEIFFPQSSGVYRVRSSENVSFMEACEEAGFRAYGGETVITLNDGFGRNCSLSVYTDTDGNPLLPDYGHSGLRYPKSGYTGYRFFGWQGENGFTGAYEFSETGEDSFTALWDISGRVLTEQTLTGHLELPDGQIIVVSVHGSLPDGTSLKITSSDTDTEQLFLDRIAENAETDGQETEQNALREEQFLFTLHVKIVEADGSEHDLNEYGNNIEINISNVSGETEAAPEEEPARVSYRVYEISPDDGGNDTVRPVVSSGNSSSIRFSVDGAEEEEKESAEEQGTEEQSAEE